MSTEVQQAPAPLSYVGSFEELLAGAESADPRYTKVDAFELPRTKNLDQQFVITFSGPEAAAIGAFVYEKAGELARQVGNHKDKQPQG